MSSQSVGRHYFKKPKTAEDKKAQQEAKIQLLREALAKDWNELEGKLTRGGEFRNDEKFDDIYLRRWLKVHHWKIEKAEAGLREHANWRPVFCPVGGRVQETEIAKELSGDKIQLQGVDNHGRGFCVVVCRRHSSRDRDPDEMERLMCFALDKQLDIADLEKNPQRRICTLFDLSKMSMVSIDLTLMHRYYSLLAHHFVDRFGKLYLYNAPMIFWATWKAFSPIIPQDALAMIKFIYPKDLSELHADVPMEILPKDYGGQDEFISVQNYKT